MMKVVSAKTMAMLESISYQQGCNEMDFMEEAGYGIAEVVKKYIEQNNLLKEVVLLCGKGNNAGDGFVAACYLMDQGYKVYTIQPESIDNCSALCRRNRSRYEKKSGLFFECFEKIQAGGVILDAIFGTGFKGQVKEPYFSLIQAANKSGKPILSIDIPSGLDGNTGDVESCAIQASVTIFLGLPKTGFFFGKGWNCVGQLKGVDFGLPAAIMENTVPAFELIIESEIAKQLPEVVRNRHKYQAGYAAGLAGSPTMPGAAMLSSLAALRGGSGMVKLLHPRGMEAELAASPYELIKIPYEYNQNYGDIIDWMNKAQAIFVGPGLGRTEAVRQLLQQVIPHLNKPCVIDADALTLLSENSFDLPSHAILTPHLGEMQRLLKSSFPLILNNELLEVCQNYAEENNATLVLKGAPTLIFHPGVSVLVNPTGDPGMATAGSGDVLTGLIASLLSQGLSQRNAAALGVYLHGLAGEYAAQEHTSYCMIATDLIANLSRAIKRIERF